jgi:hypothetical protein
MVVTGMERKQIPYRHGHTFLVCAQVPGGHISQTVGLISCFVGLGWGPDITIFTSSQMRVMLLVWGPHFKNQYYRVLKGLDVKMWKRERSQS